MMGGQIGSRWEMRDDITAYSSPFAAFVCPQLPRVAQESSYLTLTRCAHCLTKCVVVPGLVPELAAKNPTTSRWNLGYSCRLASSVCPNLCIPNTRQIDHFQGSTIMLRVRQTKTSNLRYAQTLIALEMGANRIFETTSAYPH
jgi:hypothetical protein